MSYQSMEEAKLRGEKENIPFWKAIQLEDAQERDVKIEDSWEKMKYMWQSMLDALDAYEPDSLGRINVKGTLKIKSLNKDSIMDSAGLPID